MNKKLFIFPLAHCLFVIITILFFENIVDFTFISYAITIFIIALIIMIKTAQTGWLIENKYPNKFHFSETRLVGLSELIPFIWGDKITEIDDDKILKLLMDIKVKMKLLALTLLLFVPILLVMILKFK